MEFLDAFIDEKIRKYYLMIIKIDEQNRNYTNKLILYANIRDKIRLFNIVIETKKKHEMDFSDDLRRKEELIKQLNKLKNANK